MVFFRWETYSHEKAPVCTTKHTKYINEPALLCVALVISGHILLDVYNMSALIFQGCFTVTWIINQLRRCYNHHSDVTMSAMASQNTGVSIVYSTVCSGVDQRKHQSSASLAFERGIHRWLVNSPHKGPQRRKCFHLMTSSICGLEQYGWQQYLITVLLWSIDYTGSDIRTLKWQCRHFDEIQWRKFRQNDDTSGSVMYV